MNSGGTLRQLPAVIVSFVALFAANVPIGRGALAQEPSQSGTADLRSYMAYFGLDSATAESELALIEEARELQARLESNSPHSFAGIWFEHEPNLRVVVSLTDPDESAAARALASSELAPFLVIRTHQYSLRDLESVIRQLSIPGTDYTASLDVTNNTVEIDVLQSGRFRVEQAVGDQFPTGLVVVNVVNGLPRPVASIYGGVFLFAWCGGNSGTAGWSVINASELTGIMTAGHLANCLRYNSTNLVYQAGTQTGNADAQWNSSPVLTELPKFKSHEDGSTRPVYFQRTYSNIIVGDFVCKYGQTTGYGCGVVETKVVDPDGAGPYNPVFVRVADCGGETLADEGDSGGPVFLSNTAIGSITFEDPGDIFCGGKMVFNSVTHTQARLNVSLLFATP